KCLVISEVGLSLVLLVGAGLMIRTFLAVQQVDLGFRSDRLLAMRIPLSEKRYPYGERRVAFFQELQERVKSLPGVTAVGLNTSFHPFGNWRAPVEVVGSPPGDARLVVMHQINTDYAKAFGIKLVQGRLFDDVEVRTGRHLAVVNQTFVR